MLTDINIKDIKKLIGCKKEIYVSPTEINDGDPNNSCYLLAVDGISIFQNINKTWEKLNEGTGGGGGGSNIIDTLDQTLTAGNSTKQKIIWNDTGSVGNGITFTEIKPINYNTAYTLGTSSSFTQGYAYYPGVNASGRPNMVGLLWGYNGGFNTATLAGEPTWGVRTETWFETGGTKLSEFHGVTPEFKAINGSSRRLGTCYTNNETGYSVYSQQIDQYVQYDGILSESVYSCTRAGAAYRFANNAALTLTNFTNTTNFYNMTLSDGGVVFGTGGLVASTSSFLFLSPSKFTTHATLGTAQQSAIQSTVGVANYSALRVEQSGLSTSDFYGIFSASVNTSGIYTALHGQNTNAAGMVRSLLIAQNGATAAYHLRDAAVGIDWSIGKITSGDATRSMKISFGTSTYDSLLKFSGAGTYAGFALFKYSVAIGTVEATARLLLPAGTATASTAPLKLTSGTNLTTAETGAVEYNGTNLFFTRTGTTRESIITANAVNTVSPTSPNRTITVVIDGTTYYLSAKTTND